MWIAVIRKHAARGPAIAEFIALVLDQTQLFWSKESLYTGTWMEADVGHETLPLLGISQSNRLHYLDNLRATLTVVLIFHHAVMQVISPPLALNILVLTNRSALWALFFFVSGRSAALALSNSSDYHFLISRLLKIGLPAWIYPLLIRPLLVVILSLAWKNVFGVPGVYTKLSGPIAYVSILIFLDSLYLLLRWSARQSPNIPLLQSLASLRMTSRTQFLKIATFTIAALAAFDFLRSILSQIEPHSFYHPYFFDSYDQPGVDAPLSYIIAYLVGVHFETLKEYLTLGLPGAYIFLLGSFLMSYTTLATYYLLIIWSIPLTSLRVLVQCITFALWDTFVFCTIPIGVISIFSQASWATREWGFLARHTYIQTYVNMIPILIADYFARRIGEPILHALLTGLFGVVVSWTIMIGLVLLGGNLVHSRNVSQGG